LAKREHPPQVAGIGLALVGARGSEPVTQIAAHVALGLASGNQAATLVDFRPFSVEHCAALGVAPRPAPVSLAAARGHLGSSFVVHPSGLRLLNNLEGTGTAGQLTPDDVAGTLDALLAQGDPVIVELPLYPVELLREAATRCALVALVTAFDPPALPPARAALGMMERLGLSAAQTNLILVGPPSADRPDLGRNILATVPPEASVDHPAFRDLATKLQGLCKT
jgi:Flp pilus assembly CpaE family ATPase